MSLNKKAKTLNELFWENVTEWNKWLRTGLTEPSRSELSAKYQEKWVRLEDAEHEIEKIHRKYEMVISTAEKDCAECFQASKASKQKLRYKNIECASITENGKCLLDKMPCVCLNGYCQCRFSHKHNI